MADLIEATVGWIQTSRVVMEMPSEEVVTHHLDELWQLGPGENRGKKIGRKG